MWHYDDPNRDNVMEGIRRGDRRSFAVLFKDFYPTLTYFANRLVNQEVVAEEMAMDAFMKLWEYREQMREDKSARSWLYRVTRNACIDHLRRNKLRIASMPEAMEEECIEEGTILEAVIAAETNRRLHEAVRELPGQCRKVFSMQYFEGKSTREIADHLNISLSTVKEYKARGLSILRRTAISILPYFIPLSGFFIPHVVSWQHFPVLFLESFV